MHGLVFSTGHTQYHAYILEASAILTPLYISNMQWWLCSRETLFIQNKPGKKWLDKL